MPVRRHPDDPGSDIDQGLSASRSESRANLAQKRALAAFPRSAPAGWDGGSGRRRHAMPAVYRPANRWDFQVLTTVPSAASSTRPKLTRLQRQERAWARVAFSRRTRFTQVLGFLSFRLGRSNAGWTPFALGKRGPALSKRKSATKPLSRSAAKGAHGTGFMPLRSIAAPERVASH